MNDTINYRKSSEELKAAYFIYREAQPPHTTHVVDFAAGWNAAMEQIKKEKEGEK